MTASFRDPQIAQPDFSTASLAENNVGEQGLPDHQAEMTAGHEGRPTMAEQDARNGAGRPAEDRGVPQYPGPGPLRT